MTFSGGEPLYFRPVHGEYKANLSQASASVRADSPPFVLLFPVSLLFDKHRIDAQLLYLLLSKT